MNASTAGAAAVITDIRNGDGIAIAASPDGGPPPYLLANRTDGKITKIDLTVSPAATTDIMTDGTRGDFVAVDNEGCMYATQSDRVLKLTTPCGLQPPVCGAGDPVRQARRNPPTDSNKCETELFASVTKTAAVRALTGGYASRQVKRHDRLSGRRRGDPWLSQHGRGRYLRSLQALPAGQQSSKRTSV